MIIVHDGRAHADDFLAACVCFYKLGLPVSRQSADSHMIEDPLYWVVDQGRSFEPELHNFDHHQLEEEICAFTMVLDYFYGKDYRIFMPNLRYIEIFDSYGPSKAADFAGIKQENLDLITSPIHTSLLKAFSKIQGIVNDSFLSIMHQMGKELCEQIESNKLLLDVLTKKAVVMEHGGIKILDTTKCVMPDGHTHDHLPTKAWSKINDYDPQIILTMDSRNKGCYRMVSINTNTVKFKPNEKCYFVHNSGFLVGFENYQDYIFILENYVDR